MRSTTAFCVTSNSCQRQTRRHPRVTIDPMWTAALILFGWAMTAIAFWLPTPSIWMRLITVISVLGLVGLAASWRERHTLSRVSVANVALGVLTGVAMYGVARLLCRM